MNGMSARMPVIFIGHGNPLNVLLDNDFTRGWAAIGRRIPKPRAILSISAHWYVAGTYVTAMPAPRTIHDFGGFPPEMYAIEYPAPGDPELARRVQSLLADVPAGLDAGWGLDHGTWSVLYRVFPRADVPVIQLSIDATRPPSFHYETGKRLAPLRGEGVLIIGSGNLVHNLHAYAWGRKNVEPFDWGVRFERKVREFLAAGEDRPLIEYEKLGPDAILSAPTPDHYLPLLYVLATRQQGEKAGFPVEGFDGGSVSMLTLEIGSGE
jgi:4,5-DOPA dioxygenase extradiol